MPGLLSFRVYWEREVDDEDFEVIGIASAE
jgi:hypothetical protein